MSIPVLRVQLSRVGSAIRLGHQVPAIVDSGATWSLFPAEMGDRLGVIIEDGRREETYCSNGEVMEIFIHPMRIAFGDYHSEMEVGFGEYVSFPVLGRIGFFERFKITFDYSLKPPGLDIVPI